MINEKPLTFEELEKVDNQVVDTILRKVSQFLDDVHKIEGSEVGVTITHKNLVIFQQETKNGLIITKETRFRQYKKQE